MKKRLLYRIGPLLGIIVFAVALWFLHRELTVYHYPDVVRLLKDLPLSRLFLSLMLTILSYLILTGYDSLAFRYIRHPVPYGRIALTSFIGYAFSHNIGHSWLSGGSVRYRLYTGWGLSAIEVAKVVMFCAVTFWLGFLTLGGLVFLVEPLTLPATLHLPFMSIRPLGWIFLAIAAGYPAWCALQRKPLRYGNWEFAPPSASLSLFQVVLASADWALAGMVLYVLLPPSVTLSYPAFIGIFLLAQVIGVASLIPGGLGVFETVIVLLLSANIPASAALG
jgi:uncharacterized membrane protein YbhN (UPF0104 family)